MQIFIPITVFILSLNFLVNNFAQAEVAESLLDTTLNSANTGLIVSVTDVTTIGTSTVGSQVSTLKAPETLKSPKKNYEIEAKTSFESSGYLTAASEQNPLYSSHLALQDFNWTYHPGDWNNKIDLMLGRFVNGSPVYAVQEIYTSKNWGTSSITVGRRILNWSEADKNWDLGLWQPLYKLDSLRPSRQGLTGLFYDFKKSDIQFRAFLTPIFIPTMQPEIKEKEGALVSNNRWFQSPSKNSYVIGKETDVVYSLEQPDVESLVKKPAVGLRFQWGEEEKGPWASVQISKKPINSLLIKYSAKLLAANSTGQATVGPAVGYHTIAGFDFGFNLEGTHTSFSFIDEQPEKTVPTYNWEKDWVQQQPGSLRIYTFHYDSLVNMSFFREPVRMSFDYSKAFENLSSDFDSQGLERSSLFPHRLAFTNAASVKAEISSRFVGKKTLTEFKYLRDFEQNGSVITSEIILSLNNNWLVNGGVDVLSVDDSSDSNQDNRFINQFRANDRVFGGLSYVF